MAKEVVCLCKPILEFGRWERHTLGCLWCDQSEVCKIISDQENQQHVMEVDDDN